jgi:GNAT superfamily N-acetyltransferase
MDVGFAPELTVAGVTFSECAFSSLRDEGGPLFALHWLEASADRSVALRVDWEGFKRLEAAGFECCVAARRDGRLVGYAVFLIGPSLHYAGRLIGDADAYFLLPSERRGPVGVALLRAAEAALRRRGVTECWARVKLHVQPGRGRRDLRVLFARLGFRAVEILMRKRLN